MVFLHFQHGNMNNRQKEIMEYFRNKASEYDLVEEQIYWKLSDQLLGDIFDQLVLSRLPENFYFLDAGGGTGRWSEKILREYDKSQGMIYDISSDMLKQAEFKRMRGLENRLELRQGNIERMNDINDSIFDLTFNFHNVLGFVDSPENAMREMTRVTKNGGYVVSVVPNQYHCVYFNLMLGRINEAVHAAEEGKGRFTLDMPYIHLFTPQSIRELYQKVGLKEIEIYGFPITIYPGMEETQITGSSEGVKNLLENVDDYEKIYKLEKKLLMRCDASGRGNNLFVFGTKMEMKK
jgi:ubiquinone/menaquinone biosynthesis C-methylase UbiE